MNTKKIIKFLSYFIATGLLAMSIWWLPLFTIGLLTGVSICKLEDWMEDEDDD